MEVVCWVHARRKFDESASSRPEEATEILARIGRLYRLEKEWRDLGPEDRCRLRKTRARPILEGIFSRLKELKSATVPSEPLRGAVNYALNQREALCRYLQDGRLKPDNPACGGTTENAIRPLALGRKNRLFAGSERGARAAALFYSPGSILQGL
ncbi:MAG: transposase [Deltaproteobacteria bacterium]|nr:transposase [Deltaproteobacteria bacterium]MBW1924889.1 transposase [Deltaproteobacteria bacterium]MBW1950056.1 transposase [Deltaproteobacteria bacterium]